MSRLGDFLITVIGGGCATALKALKDNTSELANNIARGILSLCGALAFGAALFGGPTKKPELPPPADTPPAQHAPAPASNQNPKKGRKGIEQPPKTSVKPARRGQQGFIVLNSGTVLYFDRKRRHTNNLENEIQKQRADILDAELIDSLYSEY